MPLMGPLLPERYLYFPDSLVIRIDLFCNRHDKSFNCDCIGLDGGCRLPVLHAVVVEIKNRSVDCQQLNLRQQHHHHCPSTTSSLTATSANLRSTMKQRFSSLDVNSIVHELSKALLTLRVSNIYDLSTKIFLIKFAKPDQKQQIVIDTGFRCHLTEFSRATAAAPSPFVLQLRKYLKTRRVTSIAQVGTDRIIEFQFSEGQYKLYLEFYASGNIILTDRDLKILALQRIVHEGEGQEELRNGLTYSLENRQNYGGVPELTKDRLKNALQKAVNKEDDGLVAGKKPKKKGADALRKALAVSITEYPPMLVDHAMRVTDFDSSLKPSDVMQSEDLLDQLLQTLEEAKRVVQEMASASAPKGYIIANRKDGAEDGALLYSDFQPYKPKQFVDDPASVFIEYDGFNAAVDSFFSSIEGQRLEGKLEERELTAKRKIEAARRDQASRLDGLKEVQELHVRKAQALEANAERVQEAMDAVNGLISQGMDWVEIGKLIELQQKRNNPVAVIIKLPLKLEDNTITLLLDEEELIDEEDDANETDSDVSDSDEENSKPKEAKQKLPEKRLVIDIDLSLTPWSNAREYFDQKKTANEKAQKTIQSSSKALKAQEAKIANDLKRGLKTEKAVLRPVRRQLWFERFTWFISSDGYLVLAGKDLQQQEILYKKYLKKGDVYLHCDIQGAVSVIVRNNPKTPDAPIPPSTLSQAGTLVIATSTAWDSKAGMSAYWVNADQVSKSAPTGGFMPVGSFAVSGKKNFLPPATLLLGFGVMFNISEESKARHMKHRVQEPSPSGGSSSDATPAGGSIMGESEVPTLENDDSSEEENNLSDDEESTKPQDNLLQSEPRVQPDSVEEGALGDENTPPTNEIEELKLNGLQDGDDTDSESDDEIPITHQRPAQTQKPKAAPPQAKRGQKAKAKKIATKYKDQDEEDRLAAITLLGSVASKEKAQAEARARAAKEAEAALAKERRRAQHLKTQKETAEHEEQRKLMLQQGADEEEDEIHSLDQLDGLVGTPLPEDEILEAIPMCAPWAAMGRCKYKAKLQPGSVKKGKAVKEILAKWVGDVNQKHVDEESRDVERIWPRELELIKAWKPEEVNNTVCVSRVRVMMSGGSAGGSAAAKGGQKGGGRGGRGSKKR